MKECRLCHQLLDESLFSANPRNKDGLHSYCKKCVALKAKKFNLTKGRSKQLDIYKKQKESGYFVFGHGAYSNKKRSAAKRGIDFSLTEEEFSQWYKNNEDKCYYCGCSLSEYIRERDFLLRYNGNNKLLLETRKTVFNTNRSKNITVMTVDRKDSSKGYNLTNIVKSCWICNSLKSNKMSETEAKINLKRIKVQIRKEMSSYDRKKI